LAHAEAFIQPRESKVRARVVSIVSGEREGRNVENTSTSLADPIREQLVASTVSSRQHDKEYDEHLVTDLNAPAYNYNYEEEVNNLNQRSALE
jgi:hypothetical protein